MESKLIQLTDELWEAIEVARGDEPRGRWLERTLRRVGAVRSAAAEMGLEFQERPKPGQYDRTPLRGKPRGTRIHG